MIERRRFLTMSASGIALGAAAAALPAGAAQATTSAKHGLPVRLSTWSRLAGSAVTAKDPHGHILPLTVESVVKDQPIGGGRGESFRVVLRARNRKLPDGIYRLAHQDLGGSAHMFLVGGGGRTATLSVDTRKSAPAS